MGWMAIGLTLYVVYRRNQGLTLTETREDRSAQGDRRARRRVRQRSSSPSKTASTRRRPSRQRSRWRPAAAVESTCWSRSPSRRTRRSTRRCPRPRPRAATAIERARVVGGRRVTGHWEKVRAGEAGRRIVDEAAIINARAIVMPLTPQASGSLFPASGAEGALRAAVPRDPDLRTRATQAASRESREPRSNRQRRAVRTLNFTAICARSASCAAARRAMDAASRASCAA